MSHLILTHQQNSEIVPRAVGFNLRIKLGPITALILMMLLVGLMGLLSLTHLNSMSTKGYVINKLEDEHQTYVNDGEINDVLILQARSMKTIEDNEQVLSMVQPEHVYYLESVMSLAQAD